MRNRSSCPKCSSIDIVRIPGKNGTYGVGNNIQTNWGAFSPVLVTRYLCCNCGYSEEWIDSKEDINKLKSKYEHSGK